MNGNWLLRVVPPWERNHPRFWAQCMSLAVSCSHRHRADVRLRPRRVVASPADPGSSGTHLLRLSLASPRGQYTST